MFITQCNISCIFLFFLSLLSLLLMLSMPQKSKSRSTLTKKYQRNKEKQEKKKKPWAATTICSKFTFFSVLLPDKALIKTAMCSVKLVLVLVTSLLPRIHLHDGFTVATHSLTHKNTHCRYCFSRTYSTTCRNIIDGASTFVYGILINIYTWVDIHKLLH